MYFYYGISHSTLENPDEEIELKVDQNTYSSPPEQNEEQTAVWDRHGYENRMAEDGNSWNGGGSGGGGGGGCWNAGWGEKQPSITVNSDNNSRSSGTHNNGVAKKQSSNTKKSHSSSGGASKTKAGPPPPPAVAKKPPAASKPTQSVPSKASQPQSAPKKDGFGMFVEETHFPSWDD